MFICVKYFIISIPLHLLFTHSNVHFSSVTPKIDDLKIEGLPDNIQIGSTHKLTVNINRIRPPATQTYWNLTFGRRHSGRTTTHLNEDGKTYNQKCVFEHQ